MIDRDHDLSIVRQAKVLKLARSTVYYEPRPVSAEDLALMRRLDELHLDYPFAGARMLRSLLRREGVYAGRRHIATLMKRMRIEAVYRRPNTSKPAPGHKIYPYLLRGLKIERPDHAWAMDITYIPMRRGFVYLAAVVDVFSRRVLAHRVSITMEAAFCVEAVQEALAKHGRPEIFNTDQGSQFTSLESPMCCWTRRSPSAWTARAPGATTCLSSGSGARSNTKKYISAPTTACPRRERQLPSIWPSTIRDALTRALTGARPTRLTSARKLW
ncbi:hypothetical protein ABIF66_008704 [Bradyrhizobium japonicum]